MAYSVFSSDGKIQKIFFYDENELLVKTWELLGKQKNGLLWYEYDLEKNFL
ncbi:MAG: hypothetical protein K6E97_01860 [Treponema sp.]|nr:hypothetical protein [Treponema sp.]